MSRHPSPEALVDFMDGRLSRRDNARVVGHLLSGCRECREVTGAGWARIEEGLRAARGEIREAEVGMVAASPSILVVARKCGP